MASRKDSVKSQKMVWKIFDDLKLVKSVVGGELSIIRGKILVLIFFIARMMCRILFVLKIVKTCEFTYKLIISDILVRNEDGIFLCRKKTVDILYTSPHFERQLKNHFELKEGVFIDVGAHIGRYTIMVAKKLRNDIVIALEPEPENFQALKKNVSLNGLKNVILLNLAASNKDEKVVLYKLRGPHTDWHSMTNPKSYYESIVVPARRLDDIITRFKLSSVDLIKIDVEGAELLVLQGLESRLKDVKKIIYESPVEKDECKEFLEKHGFKIVQIVNLGDRAYKIAENQSLASKCNLIHKYYDGFKT